MTRVAAIDCGTNSLRLLIADVAGATQSEVHREMRVVRLGAGVDRTGRLDDHALARTRAALVDYAALCRTHGVVRTRMVATSATRDASNRDAFSEMVQDVLGVPPEVITGEQEAALSFAGATRGLPSDQAPYLVVDIGGGSTEVVLGSQGVTASRSVDIGCVRLTERHLVNDPPTPAQLEAAQADIAAALDDVAAAVPVDQARTAVGLAGSVTTVAALVLGLDTYDSARIHRSVLSADDVRRWSDRLLAMTRTERAGLAVMHPGRVDVIGAGALVLRSIVDRFALTEISVSETDILDGIAASTGGTA